MKSAYIVIALFGLVCALYSLTAYGDPAVEFETGLDSSCVFLNNLALFANACAVYSVHPIPPSHGTPPPHAGPPDHAGPPNHSGAPDHAGPPDHAGGPEAANCIGCHGVVNLVSANLVSYASAYAMYNPHPGPRPHDLPPPVSSCTLCHDIAETASVSLQETVSRSLLESFSGHGGGIYNDNNSSPTLINCTFSGNGAGTGGGIYNDDSSTATVTNCILWGDIGGEIGGDPANVTYSCIQGGYGGAGNISDDPLFADAASGYLCLWLGSPCIDTGTSVGAPTEDLFGFSRPQGDGFDMGAYEFYEFLTIIQQPLSQTVDPGDSVMFVVEAIGTPPLSYQWKFGFDNIPDATSSTCTIDSVLESNQGPYSCVVMNYLTSAPSAAAVLSVNNRIQITTQPRSQTVPEGTPGTTFWVGVWGSQGPVSYQWRKDGMDLTGGDQSVYTITRVQVGHEGSYTCLVTDDANGDNVESDIAILTVLTGVPTAGVLVLTATVLAAGILGALRLRRRK